MAGSSDARTHVACAHPNIALIKYWGKADGDGNVPAVPSLSITLDTLTTTTAVRAGATDTFRLNGHPADDSKMARWLERIRRDHPLPPLQVDSENNFPTAAGLASSASGYAALITAIDAAFTLGLTAAERSDLARQGSASAARSIHGGFVALRGPTWQAEPLASSDDWPLNVVVAITDPAAKSVASSAGMQSSASTSPYYPAWVATAEADYAEAAAAVAARDFPALAAVAERSCLKMHAVMLSTHPALLYWNATTVACLQRVRSLREQGEAVFFTIDAGPQVKAVCTPASRPAVAAALAAVPGVQQVMVAGLGGGARIVTT